MSVNDRLKELFQLIKRKLIELNLFKSVPPSQDEVLRQERYTTRIYLIVLLLTVTILGLFTSIRPQTIRIIIKSPSLTDFIQLYEQHSLTLDCPCSQPAIDKKFICHIKPQYHEICLSEFVSSEWINAQFFHQYISIFENNFSLLLTHDIRYQSQFHFQLLSTLCYMANQTIQDFLQLFYQTKFISNQMLSNQSFQIQIDLIMDQFKRTVPESFQRTFNLIKTNFENNLFITPMNSNFRIHGNVDGTMPSVQLTEFGHHQPKIPGCTLWTLTHDIYGCYCFPSSFEECVRKTIIFEGNTQSIIPGMFQSWFPFQSLLMSTLECFYNDTCLSQILEYINSTESTTNFTTLNSSLLSLNDDNNEYDKIESLANNLFLQSWMNGSSFESYFNHCKPLTCEHTYESRPDLIYIVTKTIGLIGGVNVFLSLLLPFVVKFVVNIWNNILQHQRGRENTVRETQSMRTRKKLYENFL